MTERDMLVSDLADLLADELKRRNWTLREAAVHLRISKTHLSDIIARKHQPDIRTLSRVAVGLSMPLWRVIELAGYDLQLPAPIEDQARRLAELLDRAPEYREVTDMLLALRPNDLAGVLAYLEALERQRSGRRAPPQ